MPQLHVSCALALALTGAHKSLAEKHMTAQAQTPPWLWKVQRAL